MSTDDSFDLELAAASLRADASDVRILLKVLVDELTDALGPRLHVQRAGGRFRKGDEIRSVRIELGDDEFEAVADGKSLLCGVGHSSGGIRIRNEKVDMGTWLSRLLESLRSEATRSQGVSGSARGPGHPGSVVSPTEDEGSMTELPGDLPEGASRRLAGARARPLHLRSLGQRIPAHQGSRLPPPGLRDGVVDLSHRASRPAAGGRARS